MGWRVKSNSLSGFGAASFDTRMVQLMGRVGSMGAALPVGLNSLVYFDESAGIDGTFYIAEVSDSQIILWSHWWDKKSLDQIEDVFSDVKIGTYIATIPITPGNLAILAKMMLWHEDFGGQSMEINPADKEEIKWIQEFLYDNNYDIEKEGIDGVVGSVTKTALQQFQERMGIAETGVIDAATLKVISPVLVYAPAKATPAKPRATVSTGVAKPGKPNSDSKQSSKIWKRRAKYAGGALAVGIAAYLIYDNWIKDDIPQQQTYAFPF